MPPAVEPRSGGLARRPPSAISAGRHAAFWAAVSRPPVPAVAVAVAAAILWAIFGR